MKISLALSILGVLVFSFAASFSPALAHNEHCPAGGDMCIVGGWVSEPPLVNQLNGIELNITRTFSGQPISNAVDKLDLSIKKGTLVKNLEFQATEEAGIYVAEILPTQVGQYAVVMKGTIGEQAIDSQIEIEDVQDTRSLEFPTRTDNGNDPSPEILEQLQIVIQDLNEQVEQATIASEDAIKATEAAIESAAELKLAADRAYLFGMIAMGVGIAGIIIGVVALSRSKDKS